MESYVASKKLWERKQKNREDYYSSINNTSREVLSRNSYNETARIGS
jgi:hypothetical protein